MKTAAELGIQTDIYEALLDVMRGLEDGEFTHCVGPELRTVDGKWFNMEHWGKYDNCNTVSCIGGWIAKLLGKDIQDTVDYDIMYELFYPSCDLDWNSITPQIAAHGIRKFLEKGTIDWKKMPGVKIKPRRRVFA